MTVDLIDRAFLRRFAETGVADMRFVAAPASGQIPDPEVPSAPDERVIAFLLETCPEQWDRLADHVEATWATGARVVAVAGRMRGDGVSTVVAGIARVLRHRGRLATVHSRATPSTCAISGVERAGGPTLVDGGAWFPPGPVHRGRLARAAFGCHAAILVRRAARAPCPAHAAALAVLGIEVLGEVATFAGASPAESPTQ